MSWGVQRVPRRDALRLGLHDPGITYIAASGDTPGVDYPAASPDVLAVGGTTLNLNASGGYGSETAWYDSGGGYSQFESEPAYQQSVQTTGQRSVPDVAFDADPNTGARSTSPRRAAADAGTRARPRDRGRSSAARAWAPVLGGNHRDRRPGPQRGGSLEPQRGHADLTRTLPVTLDRFPCDRR